MPLLRFNDNGQGSPIVLLHAFPLDSRVWAGDWATLCRSLRVITPDLRGFGGNPPVAELNVNEMAADVAELIEYLHVSPCAVGGLSMGGYVAQALTRDFPKLVNRLILIDSKAAADTPAQRTQRDVLAKLALEQGNEAVFDHMKESLLGPNPHRQDLKVLRFVIECQSPISIAAGAKALRDRDDFSPFLSSLKIPVHLIFGENDAMMPPEAARALQSTVAHATLTIIPGGGHLSPIEKPFEVNAAISAVMNPSC